jgi:hypothetical protein
MGWVLLIGITWLVAAAMAAVLIGRGIRLADRRAAQPPRATGTAHLDDDAEEPNFVVDEPAAPPAQPAPPERPRSQPSEPPLNGGFPAPRRLPLYRHR